MSCVNYEYVAIFHMTILAITAPCSDIVSRISFHPQYIVTGLSAKQRFCDPDGIMLVRGLRLSGPQIRIRRIRAWHTTYYKSFSCSCDGIHGHISLCGFSVCVVPM